MFNLLFACKTVDNDKMLFQQSNFQLCNQIKSCLEKSITDRVFV